MANFRQKKGHRMGASRTRQVSMKVDDELIRDSGRVLNGAPQFLGRLEWGATVAGRRFSTYQGLWTTAGRSGSRAAVCHASSFMCVC
jgi:hypothetical protein